MKTTEYKKPLPHPTGMSESFWKGLREHRLLVQKCEECGRHVFPPRPFCVYCLSDQLRWDQLSGEGTVVSYTIVRRSVVRGFEEDVPYVLAIVELGPYVQMTTNIIRCPVEKLCVGMSATAVFEDVTNEFSLVKFYPA